MEIIFNLQRINKCLSFFYRIDDFNNDKVMIESIDNLHGSQGCCGHHQTLSHSSPADAVEDSCDVTGYAAVKI